MKILYICRLFSGLENSLLEGRWRPYGAPAIYKMIEKLDQGEDEVRFVLTNRNTGSADISSWKGNKDREVKVEGLRHPVCVLAGEALFPRWTGRFRGYLSELRQIVWVLWEMRRFCPDLIYFDRANVIIAGVIARFFRVPVVLRVMGVTPEMHQIVLPRRPFEKLLRWAYRSPFALVLCTLDGSGGESWMEKILPPSVPRIQLLNGVEVSERPPQTDPHLESLPKNKMIVLFLGRLEPIKGAGTFVDAILKLWDGYRDRLHAVVVGYGSEENGLRCRIEDAGAKAMFTFIDRLPHVQVIGAYMRADVYVSLNRQGNLSNANLEAMALGCCTVIPESKAASGVDIDTDRLLPQDAAIRISHDNQVESLAKTLADLCDHSEKREMYAQNIGCAAKSFLSSWSDRIARELELLSRISRREPLLSEDWPGGD